VGQDTPACRSVQRVLVLLVLAMWRRVQEQGLTEGLELKTVLVNGAERSLGGSGKCSIFCADPSDGHRDTVREDEMFNRERCVLGPPRRFPSGGELYVLENV